MSRLRALTPWLLALLALAWAAAPHLSRPTLLAAAPYLAAALLLLLLAALVLKLSRRRHRRPRDPQAERTTQHRRALTRLVTAARRHHPRDIFLFLGLPGHGKSTLLSALGPHRALAEALTAPAVQLTLSTTQPTLLLEHPGLPCDLHPLRALRPRQPLDAIVIVLGLPELLTADPTTLATTLRPQLLAVLTTLAVAPPISLVLSKLDRIAGHTELAHAAHTPWSFELTDLADLPTHLRAWSQWVLTQRLAQLTREPDPDRRARLYTFGAQFTRICERIETFATVLFADTSHLRSLHFIAAAPSTIAPTDTLLTELATTVHTRLRAPHSASHTPLASDLAPLLAILRHRSREATRTPALLRAAQRHSHLFAATLALVAGGLARTGITTADHAQTRLQALADLTPTLASDDPTAPLLALRSELDTWPRSTPITLTGLFTPALHPTLLALYRQTARERLLRAIWRHLATTLGDQATHDQLRAYLLLTTTDDDLSLAPGPLDPLQKDWLLAELPRLADTNTPGELTLLLTTLLAHATADDLRFPRDHTLVERTRARLRALDDDETVVRAALVAGDRACEPLSLRALTHAEQLSGATDLPCSFTRVGWPRVHAQLVHAAAHRDGWIVGRPVQDHADPARLTRLRGRYEALYIAAWTDFLAGIRIRRPADLVATSRLLAELTSDERPLTQLFTALDHHTRGLQHTTTDTPSLTHLLQGPGQPEHSAAISRAFAPLLQFAITTPDRQAGLDRYHARLAELRDALEAARRDPAELPALHTQLTTALGDTHALLQHADLRRFRPLLSTLLLPPLTALQSELRDHNKLSLTRAYCSEVDAPLRRLISRYPFVADAREELSLDELTAFFHPETGTLRRFRDTQLADLITIHGTDIVARPGPRDEDHPISPAVLALLARAAELGALAFPGNALGLELGLDLQCNADIGRVRFTLDGATHDYTCGPDHHTRMTWPGKAEPRGALLELHGRDGRRETIPGPGPWGLWRLLEKDGLVLLPTDRSRPRLLFRLDLRASRLGTLELAITPPRTHGASLLFGAAPNDDTPLLAPLRSPALLDPPTTLFVGLPTCAALPPT